MPIPLRADFDALRLRAIARGAKDSAQTRRLLALAAIYDGARRTEAAAIGGVTLQIVRIPSVWTALPGTAGMTEASMFD